MLLYHMLPSLSTSKLTRLECLWFIRTVNSFRVIFASEYYTVPFKALHAFPWINQEIHALKSPTVCYISGWERIAWKSRHIVVFNIAAHSESHERGKTRRQKRKGERPTMRVNYVTVRSWQNELWSRPYGGWGSLAVFCALRPSHQVMHGNHVTNVAPNGSIKTGYGLLEVSYT